MSLILLIWLAVYPLVGAVSWSSTDTRLTGPPADDYAPAIAQTVDERIWVFWHKLYISGAEDIFYTTYDGGTWSPETLFIGGSNNDITPAPLVARDGTFWLFWASNTMGFNNYRILCKTSTDNGLSWSAPETLTNPSLNTTYSDREPSVIQAADGRIWVLWYSQRSGNMDLFYKIYDGQSWSEDAQLTFNSSEDKYGSIMQAQNGTIFVFWTSLRTGNYELFYKKSSNNGNSWSSEIELTFVSNLADNLSFATKTRDGTIWVFWQREGGPEDYDVYYKTYSGSTWTDDMMFVGGTTDEIHPTAFQAANKTFWVAWSSTKASDTDHDIWFRTTLPYAHDVGVASIVASPTNVYRELGTHVKIQVTVRNYGLNAESFTLILYYNSTPIGVQTVTNLSPNAKASFNFTWYPTSLPYGHYVLNAYTSTVPGETDTTDNTFNGDTVTLTMIGDVNGDGIVDMRDVSKLNVYWYDPPVIGILGYFYAADMNQDGKVNLFDSAMLNLNWGKTW